MYFILDSMPSSWYFSLMCPTHFQSNYHGYIKKKKLLVKQKRYIVCLKISSYEKRTSFTSLSPSQFSSIVSTEFHSPILTL